MHFLIDADLPRSVGNLIRSYGHNATDIRDIGMRRALDATIAQHAQREGLCLLQATLILAMCGPILQRTTRGLSC
jgi:predicted nuclease of predicted toxin-antitoxin system